MLEQPITASAPQQDQVDASAQNTPAPDDALALPKAAPDTSGMLSLPPTDQQPKPPMPEKKIYDTATKYDFAMGPSSPGIPQLQNMLRANLDSEIRRQASLDESMREHTARQQLVAQTLDQLSSQGKTLSTQGLDFLMNLGQTPHVNPKTVLEQMYAKRYVETLATHDSPDNPPTFSDAQQQQPEQTAVNMDAAQMFIARQEMAGKILSQAEEDYKNTGDVRWGWDMFKSFFPLHSWGALRNLDKNMPGSTFWTGSNLAGTIEGLYLLPPEEFQARSQQIYDNLREKNSVDAMYFATALMTYSSFHAGIDNLQTLFDVPAAIGLAKAAWSAGRLASLKLTAGIAANGARGTVRDGLAAAGNTEAAAAATVTDQIGNAARGAEHATEKVGTTMPGMADPKNYFRNIGTLSNERARRLEDILQQSDELFQQIRDGLTTVPRVDDSPALEAAFAHATEELKKTYPFLKDTLLDIIPERTSADVFGSVDHIVAYAGKTDGTWFVSPQQARLFATRWYRLPTGGYDVVPYKGQFAIRMTKPIDETETTVRDLRVATDNKTPETWINTILGWARTPTDTLGEGHKVVRDVLTYAGSKGEALLHKALQPIAKLSNKEYKRLTEIVADNGQEFRTYVRPDGSKVKLQGNWYDDVGTYEAKYLAKYGHLPSDQETAAYFTLREFYHFDYDMRNTLVRLAKERRGGEQKAITWFEPDANDKLVRKQSPYFDGRNTDRIPWDSKEPFTIAWRDQKTGKMHFALSSQMYKADRDAVDKLVAEGAHIIQPFDNAQETVGKFIGSKGEPVNYIVSPDVRTKPLNPIQVEYRAGPHAMYPTEGRYTKQAILVRTGKGRTLYVGDRTLAYHSTEFEANRFRDDMNTALRMLREGKDQTDRVAFEAFLQNHLPFNSAAQFRKFVKANGYKADMPIHTVAAGQKIGDIEDLGRSLGRDVVDTSKSVHSPNPEMGVRFTQERDRPPYSLDNSGTETNPDWKFIPTKTIDVTKTLETMSADLMRSRFYGDYVIREAENWAQQFGDLLNRGGQRAVADPYDALRFPDWKDPGKITDLAKLMAAKNSRRAILYLIGESTPAGRLSNWFRDKLLSEVDRRLGQKAVRTLEPWLWTPKTDPVRMARTFAFQTKLGIYNPRQLFLQSYAFIHSVFLTGNPIRSTRAVLMAWVSSGNDLGNFNEAYNAFLGNKTAVTLGIKPEWYKEFYWALNRSGATEVGGEVGKMDTIIGEKVLGRNFSGMIDAANRKGSIFFRAGDRFVRRVSFATAYLEWREANPTAKLTGDVLNRIIRRMNDLTINQTRASNNPMLQRGLPSLLTQFTGYQGRLAEQLTSARLTPMERVRAILGYSILHGPIVGIAGTTLVGALWPVYDQARKTAIQDGYDLNDPVTKFLLQGGLSMVLEHITGQEMNFNASYGPSGNSIIFDVLGGDVWSLGGPSAKIIQSFLTRFYPLAAGIYGVFNPSIGDEAYPLTMEDVMDAARDVGTVSTQLRTWYALKYGKLIAADGTVVADMNKRAAILNALTGIYPQKGYDTYLMRQIAHDEKADKQKIIRIAQPHFNRAMLAASEGDIKTYKLEMRKTRALIRPVFQPMEWGRVYEQMRRRADVHGTFEKAQRGLIFSAPDRETQQRRLQLWEKEIQKEYGGSPD